MRETIGSVSENASKIKDLSNEGKNLSKEIMERAIQLEESTEVSSKKTKDIYSKVKEEARLALEKSKAVEKINTLTDAIAEISEQTGLLESVPEHLQNYFDFEAYGRDMSFEGHFVFTDNGNCIQIY